MRTLWPFAGGAKAASSGVNGAVMTSAQTLTAVQQAQAQNNIGFKMARLTAADVTFTANATLATVLQLTGLTAGATYWTEIGCRAQDDGPGANFKGSCDEALDGGNMIVMSEAGNFSGWANADGTPFSTATGTGLAGGLTTPAIINFKWSGWCVADGSGNITFKGAQLTSNAGTVTFWATGSVDGLGIPGNTYIRAHKFS